MSAEFLPYVFDRFRQADMSTTRRAGGLGLGLSIVRQLVELHGGTVSATSDGEGRGSTFTVELPVSAVMTTAAATGPETLPATLSTPSTPPLRLDGRRVLALDDEPDARRVIQATLARAGAEVTLVPTVADAIGVLTADPAFDLILSDIGMPGEDGYAFIRRPATPRTPAAVAAHADRRADGPDPPQRPHRRAGRRVRPLPAQAGAGGRPTEDGLRTGRRAVTVAVRCPGHERKSLANGEAEVGPTRYEPLSRSRAA